MDFFYTRKSIFKFFILINGVQLITGACRHDIVPHLDKTPRSIYDDLKCIPRYENDCIKEYDCSHIYNKPKNRCHFKAKLYKVGEQINNEELTGVWDRDCACLQSLEFFCAILSDGCADDWVGFLKPGCYLRNKLNHKCADGEICPPFDNLSKCEVGGAVYREGDKFIHPHKKCTQCVCDTHFDGSLEPPFCQPVNCTAELYDSKSIDNNCAPFYGKKNDGCCPDGWVCLSEIIAITTHATYPFDSYPYTGPTCNLGIVKMSPGQAITMKDSRFGEVKCECNIPPFANCYPNK